MLSKYISNGGAKIHIEKIVEDKEGNACRRESENMLGWDWGGGGVREGGGIK